MIENTPTPKGTVEKADGGSPKSDNSGETTETADLSHSEDLRDKDQKTLEEQQDGLPEEIKSKTYSTTDPGEAEDELWVDLEKHSLLDSVNYIHINETGKAVFEMPTMFHQEAVDCIVEVVNAYSTEDDPIKALSEKPVRIKGRKTQFKLPDVAIWGPERLKRVERRKTHTPVTRKISVDGELTSFKVNPHVIIEVSWTNKLEQELFKLKRQMTLHNHELEEVKIGYLVKIKASNKYPTDKNRKPPLVGFDVYKIRSGVTGVPKPLMYRVGREESEQEITEIVIDGQDLDRHSPIHIPLAEIRTTLEDEYDLVFAPEDAN